MPQIGSLFVNLSMNTGQFTQQSNQAANQLQVIDKSSKQLHASLGNLSFQINDIVTGLATGQAPMRVFAQQAGQLVQVFQQGGGIRAVLGGAATAMRNFITPTTVAGAGIAALGVGFGLLVERALEAQGRVRAFDVQLRGMGLGGQATAAQLELAAKRLRDVGLSAEEAKTAMQDAIRSGIAPGQAERIVRLGQNLIPTLGANAPEQLRNAIQGGVDGLAKLVRQFGLVSAAEVQAAREAEQFGNQLQFLDRWIQLLDQHFQGANEAVLSPVGRSLRELRTTFAELLDTMSKNKFIEDTVELFNNLGKGLKFIFDLQPPDWFNKLMGVNPNSQRELNQFGFPTSTWSTRLGATGGGMSTDQALGLIEQYESGGRNIRNPKSSASGYYQFLDSTWREIAPQVGIDTGLYPTAMSASRELQRAAATRLYEQRGFSPWAPYNANLRAALAAGGGSTFARPDTFSEDFTAARQAETRRMIQTTKDQISAEELQAAYFRRGEGALGTARAQAALESASRFRQDPESAEAKATVALRSQQFFALGQARGRLALAQGGEQDRQTTEQLKLQASLFGQSTEQIERQVSLLKIRQQAEAAGLPTTDEAVKKREEEVKALSDANILLAQQRQLSEQIREIAGTFESAFSQAFDDIAQGTFNLRKLLNSLLRDIGKTLASQAFKRLLEGEPGGSGGLLGGIFGKIFGLGTLGITKGTGNGPFGDNWTAGDLGMLPAAATGGRWQVGGYGPIDSQLAVLRTSPGEMIDVSKPGAMYGGGGREVISIELNPTDGLIAAVADQRIVTRSGQIVDIAVRQSTRTVQRNFAGMSAEAQARQM